MIVSFQNAYIKNHLDLHQGLLASQLVKRKARSVAKFRKTTKKGLAFDLR